MSKIITAVLSPITALFGGGSQPSPPPAPTQANSTSSLDAAALAERRAQGRASTILAGDSLLGTDNKASKTLMGA